MCFRLPSLIALTDYVDLHHADSGGHDPDDRVLCHLHEPRRKASAMRRLGCENINWVPIALSTFDLLIHFEPFVDWMQQA